MMKLNPYAKTARRHAILKHKPEVCSLKLMYLIEQFAFSAEAKLTILSTLQIKAKMLKPKVKRVRKVKKVKTSATAPATE